MTNPEAIIEKFRKLLPVVRAWIQKTLSDSKDDAVSLNYFGYSKLSKHYPNNILDKVKIVTVAKLPSPPLAAFGLPELSDFETMSGDGITYLDTIFVREGQMSESLCFHELVHVVQWATLRMDDFILAYGVGLAQFGYKDSPLEEMAYGFQEAFDRGETLPNLVGEIRHRTNGIWGQVASLFARA